MSKTIPIIPTSDSPDLARASALPTIDRDAMRAYVDEQYNRIMRHAPLYGHLSTHVDRILSMQCSDHKKYRKLLELADRLNAAIDPYTGCGGKGCSHCCHIHVAITHEEAQWIGQAISIQPAQADKRHDLAIRDEYYAVPCTFLVGGTCSIYEHRPLACRTHHMLGPDPIVCSTHVPDGSKAIAALDMTQFTRGILGITNARGANDVRTFFPAGLSTPT